MSQNKNHHFVPCFLFRNFSEDGKRIGVLLRQTGELIYDASIKGQCARNNFYGAKEIDKEFSVIESSQKKVFDKLITIQNDFEFKTLSKHDLSDITFAVLFQRGRTELEAVKSNVSLGGLASELLRLEIENDPTAPTILKENQKDISLNPTTAYLTINKIDMLINGAPFIADLEMHILKNRTKIPFIFSDSPAVFYNRYYAKVRLRGVLGLQTPGLMIFLPVSPTTYIMFIDPSIYKGTLLSNIVINITNDNDVINLNKVQLHHSLNTIYFPSNIHVPVLHKIWRQEKQYLESITDSFIKAPGYTSSGEPLGEIMHAFEKQIPFLMNLSFLNSSVYDDRDYHFRYRCPELVEYVKSLKENHPLKNERS